MDKVLLYEANYYVTERDKLYVNKIMRRWPRNTYLSFASTNQGLFEMRDFFLIPAFFL